MITTIPPSPVWAALKKSALLGVLFAACAVLPPTPAHGTLQQLQTGMEAPDFSLYQAAGEKRSFADLKGEKLTILLIWSTWDKKSEKALARMEQLYRKYRGRGLAVVAIEADVRGGADADPHIRSIVGRLGLTYPVLVDRGLDYFHDIGIIALPTTVIVDRERVIRYELSGYPLVGAEEMADFVTASLEGARPAIAAKKGYQPAKSALRFYNMGRNTLKSGRMAESSEMWFKKAIEADPAFVLPHISLGKFYRERGDKALAEAQFREALSKEPTHVIALCESALLMFEDGRLAEGQSLLESALKADESYTPCYYYAGFAYGRQDKPEQALQMFDEAERINPLDYNLYVYKGRVFEERKRPREAAGAYRKALETILQIDETLKRTGQTPGAKTGEGMLLARAGNLKEAEQVLQAALVRNPNPVRTHYELGLVYEASGDPDKALAEYKEGIAKYRQGRK
ncbi:tetratricopeptide repeat protein [Geobacter sp. FeAm09]|uniref:TlpA disulfide reductase family protein n=1 Tax=Geobacter sp. FeAm09 TaxID=2597769 RepID=UPI0011EF5584|nr:TlpA disulfide reductase family protein [Geobacter sp. FeAm09]QEM68140.1 tetratricopeptide repeat protein [Geobacter sp. FeAm09]